MPGYYNTRCLGKMAEVVITRSWEGKIEHIHRYLSKVRKRNLKRYFKIRRKIIKNPGEVPQNVIEIQYETYEELKLLDMALEGRFNIIIVVESRWEDACII